MIGRLRDFQIGQYIREEGPKAHQKKAGTPTMGGVLIVIAIIVPTLLWADLSNRFVWIAMLSTLAFGAIGFADDYTEGGAPAQPRADRPRQAGAAVPGQLVVASLLIAMQTLRACTPPT